MCLPGGYKNSLVEKPISDKDMLGNYRGDYETGSQYLITTKGKDPVYFNRDYEVFRHFNGKDWVDIKPNDKLVFGKDIIWLGKNSELRDSEHVNNYGAALEYLTSKIEYDPKKIYCYYDKIDQYQFSDAQGINIKKIIKYIENDDNSIILEEDGRINSNFINKAVTWDGYPFNIDNPKVRLVGDNEEVVGAIIGRDNGKIEVAVEGWDIQFINGTSIPLKVGSKIIGMRKNGEYGFVRSMPRPNKIYSPKYYKILNNSKGRIVDGGYPDKSIVKVAFNFTR